MQVKLLCNERPGGLGFANKSKRYFIVRHGEL